MVVCRTDLDEPLEEHLRLAGLPFPEILQDLVGLEEVFLVEEPDALVDRVQAGRRFLFHHRSTEERGDNQLSAPPSRRASRPGDSIVRMISGAYVPRSVTVVVMSSEGVTSNVEFIERMRKPGHVAASYRASNFSASHATQNGFLRSAAPVPRPRVPTLFTTAPSRETLSAPPRTHDDRHMRAAPSPSRLALEGPPAP